MPDVDLLKSETFARAFVEDLEWRSEHPEQSKLWSSGLKEWDRLIGGIGRGWYIVIIARLKGGKTGLLGTLAINLARQKVKFAMITLEMHHLQMGARIFSNMAHIDMNKFTHLNLTEDDWKKIYTTQQEINTFDGLWNYGANNIDEIEELVTALEPQVVLVDYMGLMTLGEDSRKSRYQEIGELSRRLKGMTLPKVNADPIARKREEVILRIESQRSYLGNDSTDSMIAFMREKWLEADGTQSSGQVIRQHMFPTIITAIQTSKEQARKGVLDANSSKDSNAPAEDGDLVLAINDVKGDNDTIVQFKREIVIGASRICGEGKFTVGYNPAQARMYNDDYEPNGLAP